MTVIGCKDLCGRYDLCIKENVGYLTKVCKEYLYKHDSVRYGLEPKPSLVKITEKYVRSMVDHGFMVGYFGDRSEGFIQGEINTLLSDPKRYGRSIAGSIPNLIQYCFWTKKEVRELADHFGFKIVEAPGLVAGFTGEI